jgi:predicted DNA-binding protein (MmcQ/YjbR family)
MNVESIREYCLSKPGVEESFPFGEDTLVFKVNEKIFLLMGLSAAPVQFNVKCEPERAVSLREQHPAIIPGYHMNKKHWNTVIVDGTLSRKILTEQIDHSFELIAAAMKGRSK